MDNRRFMEGGKGKVEDGRLEGTDTKQGDNKRLRREGGGMEGGRGRLGARNIFVACTELC